MARAKKIGPVTIQKTIEPDSLKIESSREKGASEAEIYIEGLREFFRLRKKWSWILASALLLILLFNIAVVFCVGFRWISFSDEWFLRIVLGTNLADIIGLAYVVVRFLFKHPPRPGSIGDEESS